MAETRPRTRKVRTYTVAALLGIFIVAAVIAVAGRLLPGRVSGIVTSVRNRGKGHSR
jgi:hypothetical protein